MTQTKSEHILNNCRLYCNVQIVQRDGSYRYDGEMYSIRLTMRDGVQAAVTLKVIEEETFET